MSHHPFAPTALDLYFQRREVTKRQDQANALLREQTDNNWKQHEENRILQERAIIAQQITRREAAEQADRIIQEQNAREQRQVAREAAKEQAHLDALKARRTILSLFEEWQTAKLLNPNDNPNTALKILDGMLKKLDIPKACLDQCDILSTNQPEFIRQSPAQMCATLHTEILAAYTRAADRSVMDEAEADSAEARELEAYQPLNDIEARQLLLRKLAFKKQVLYKANHGSFPHVGNQFHKVFALVAADIKSVSQADSDMYDQLSRVSITPSSANHHDSGVYSEEEIAAEHAAQISSVLTPFSGPIRYVARQIGLTLGAPLSSDALDSVIRYFVPSLMPTFHFRLCGTRQSQRPLCWDDKALETASYPEAAATRDLPKALAWFFPAVLTAGHNLLLTFIASLSACYLLLLYSGRLQVPWDDPSWMDLIVLVPPLWVTLCLLLYVYERSRPVDRGLNQRVLARHTAANDKTKALYPLFVKEGQEQRDIILAEYSAAFPPLAPAFAKICQDFNNDSYSFSFPKYANRSFASLEQQLQSELANLNQALRFFPDTHPVSFTPSIPMRPWPTNLNPPALVERPPSYEAPDTAIHFSLEVYLPSFYPKCLLALATLGTLGYMGYVAVALLTSGGR